MMGDGWVMDVGCWVGYCGTIYKNWLGATQIYIYIYIYIFFWGGECSPGTFGEDIQFD